jgi:mono/diheme cytochrome c family protein
MVKTWSNRPLVAAVAGVLLLSGCRQASAPALPPDSATALAAAPSELTAGKALYDRHCASCHGDAAAGTDKGPTFLDPTYHPSHHPDQAFLLAPKVGVQAHHWQFGDMPPVEGITDEESAQILPYIRWLQQQAGIQ